MRRWFSAIGMALVLSGVSGAAAQPGVSATVVMSADRTRLEAGDLFSLSVEARVQGATGVQIQMPDLSAFEVVSMRPPSTPFPLRFGFGNAQQVQSTTRQVVRLRAREPGTVELAPAWVEIGGRRYQSNSLTFQVGGSAVPAGQSPAATGNPPPAHRADGMQYDPNGFLRTFVDESEPYVGQQVTVTVYLYIAQPLRGQPTITQEPSTDGFWVHDLLPPTRTLTADVQEVEHRRFQVYVLRRFAAFPLQAGELTIGPTALSVEGGGIWNILGARQGQAFQRTGVPVTIRVRDLPAEGRPPGDPHVGTLALTAELDHDNVATGDAVTLTVTATGRGAMEQLRIEGPRLPGLRALAPEVRDSLASPADVLGGTRTIRWLLVPEQAGQFAIGPFEVPVFDPRTASWSVARTAPLTLTAAGNPVTEERPTDTTEETRADPTSPAPTFGPIHTRSELARSHTAFSSQPWFLGLLALGPLAFVLAFGIRTARRRALSPDPKRAPKRARQAAKKQLAMAQDHAKADEPRLFYAAIAKALKDVLEAKLGRAVGSLTFTELRHHLQARGMDDELAALLVDELEGCDFARFSAVGVRGDEMESCLSRARSLLERLDRFTATEEEA